ncbi:MAG: SDR family oxidoreductase [Acidimicrobiales bacterium]|nr:SDR family oxidoreductase [Acidimicrobiales bacterium]
MVLDGKTVLISGVGPGLGTACVAAALRDGANVIATARNVERLKAAMAALDPSGERTLAAGADIMDLDAVTTAVDAGVAKFGGLDGVANVAAYDAIMGTLLDTDPETFRNVLEVNVFGTTNLVRGCVPALRANGGGSVVLIGSQSAHKPNPVPQGPYGPSKAALVAVARDLANDLGPDKIRVNTVVPTWMWGPNVEFYCQWQAGERGVEPADVKAEIESGMALREMPTDDDVAESVIFFLSERSRMVTGQRIIVNAGEYFDT